VPNLNIILGFQRTEVRGMASRKPGSSLTMAVMAMAKSSGKNAVKAGSKSVPSPKPEKNVRSEVAKATPQIVQSIGSIYQMHSK
jgi:hypothetical protein